MIDDVPVHINDAVHVLGLGDGLVTSISSDGSFEVKLGNGKVNVRKGGYIGNVRKVYWHNPMIVVPPKDEQLWTNFVRLSQNDYAQLVELFKSGKIPAVGTANSTEASADAKEKA